MKILGFLVAVVLLMAGCGEDHSAHEAGPSHDDASGHAAGGAVPGEPAPASEADREIVIRASDELSFDPATIEVSEGEVVTFVVRNVGDIDHEFVLGDEAYQAEHEEDMAESHHMSDSENAVTVAPGETKELTWRFSESGSLEFGCHEPGHYDGGMFGTIEVG